MKKRNLPVVTGDKTMLPEVLPDPRTARSTSVGPRRRTLDRMQMLFAASAAAATLSCGGGGGGGGGGYAVVDPLPIPPPRCFDPTTKVRASAVFATRDGQLTIRVRVEVLPGVEDVRLGDIIQDATAKILASNVSPRVVTADLAPVGGYVLFYVDVSPCEGGVPGAVVLDLSWDGRQPVTEATPISTTVRAEGQPWRERKPEERPITPITPGDPRYAKPPPGQTK